MRILISSFVVAGFALAATPAAADSLDLYREAFTTTPRQPAATRVVHKGSLYAEAFSASPAEAAPARPALATSAAPYTEAFVEPSLPSATKPEMPATACACSCLHRHG